MVTVETVFEFSEYHDREQLVPLIDTHYRGSAAGFVESDWSRADRHLVSYLRPFGRGAVLYNTLGHCRGYYDMRPVMDWYPRVERCSWERLAVPRAAATGHPLGAR